MSNHKQIREQVIFDLAEKAADRGEYFIENFVLVELELEAQLRYRKMRKEKGRL